MMKRALTAMAISAFAVLPALAQDSGQIQSVLDGAKKCIGCNLFQAEFGMHDLSERNFENARLRQANLSIATADKTNFKGADLSVANLFGARLQGADLTNANLRDATLVGVWLGGANLEGANLNGAVLSGAYLKTAKGLTAEQLAGAICDQSTELPPKLSLSACRTQ